MTPPAASLWNRGRMSDVTPNSLEPIKKIDVARMSNWPLYAVLLAGLFLLGVLVYSVNFAHNQGEEQSGTPKVDIKEEEKPLLMVEGRGLALAPPEGSLATVTVGHARAERCEAGTADRGTIRQFPAGIGKPPAHEGASSSGRAFCSPWREKGQPVKHGSGLCCRFWLCSWQAFHVHVRCFRTA